MRLLSIFALALVLFVAIDFIWLGFIAKNFYRSQIGPLLIEPMNLTAAVAFYLIFTAGLLVFVVLPSVAQGDWVRALWLGALFGFCAYSTYDLSNLATLKGWTTALSVVDMTWGAALTGFVSGTTVALTQQFWG